QKVRKIFNKALQKWIEKTDDFAESRHITSVGAYIGDVLQKEYDLTFEERVRALGHQYSRIRKPRVHVDTPLSQGVDQAKEFAGEYVPDEAKKVATETLKKVGEVLNDLGLTPILEALDPAEHARNMAEDLGFSAGTVQDIGTTVDGIMLGTAATATAKLTTKTATFAAKKATNMAKKVGGKVAEKTTK